MATYYGYIGTAYGAYGQNSVALWSNTVISRSYMSSDPASIFPTVDSVFPKLWNSKTGALSDAAVFQLPANEYPVSISFVATQRPEANSMIATSGHAVADLWLVDGDNPANGLNLGTLEADGVEISITHLAQTIPENVGKLLQGKRLGFKKTRTASMPSDSQNHIHLAWLWQTKVTITTTLAITACGAPTAINGKSPAAGDFILSWSGASAGINNAIQSYEVQYRDSANASGGTWTACTVTSETSATVSPNGTRGQYRQFRVRARGAAGESYYSAWTESGWFLRNTLPGAPTRLTSSPAVFESGNVSLGWNAAVEGTSVISHYQISYRTKPASGSWSGWSSDENVGKVTSKSYAPVLERGVYIQYRIRTVDVLGDVSAYAEFDAVQRNAGSSAVADLTASVTLWESGTVRLSWTKATSSTSTIAKYQIQVAVFDAAKNTDGAWTAVTDTTAVSYTATLPAFDRGNKLRYRVRAVDALGAEGAWAYTAYIVRNSLPTVPSSVKATPAIVAKPWQITVSWKKSDDADNNLALYEIQVMKSTDAGKTWSSWAGFGSVNAPAVSFSKNVSTSTYPPATRLKFRVRAKDAMGAYSDYSAESSAIKIHTVDAFPVVALPTSAVSVGSDAPDTLPDSVSSVTRRGCRSLCFKISFSASTDGLNRTLYFRLRKSNSAGKPGNEVDSFSLPFGKAKDSIFHRTPQLAAGLYRYDIWLDDGYEPVYIYGYEKLTDWPFTREILPGTVIASRSVSHQADITEMVSMLNNKRTMYGLSSVSLPSGYNGYFAKWKTTMVWIATAAKEIYTALGESATVPDQVGMYPKAAMLNAVRNLITEV